jgi:hypothetical protein
MAISELAENHFVAKNEKNAIQAVPTALTGAMRSLLLGKWHLIVHQSLGAQLYGWEDDPGELNDLSHTDVGQSVVKEVFARLQKETSEPRRRN